MKLDRPSPLAADCIEEPGTLEPLEAVAASRSLTPERLQPEFERQLRQFTEASVDYLALIDRNFNVVFVNRSLGPHSARELEGRSILHMLPATARHAAVECLNAVLATGVPGRFSVEDPLGSAILRQFDVRVSPIWHEGEVTSLTLNCSETTEQMRAQRAILMQSRMIESMLEGVALITKSGVVEITNPAFDAVFGYSRGELIGYDISVLMATSNDQRERWHKLLNDVSSQLESVRFEFAARQRAGSILDVSGVLSRFEIAARDHFLLVLQDVSERKQLERALLEAVNREQYRIGNDLHDGLGQELTGISLMLRGLAGRLTAEYPAALPEIEGITRLLSSAVESTRALARGLSPVNLERGGLTDALDGLAVHARDLYSIDVVFTHQLRGSFSLEPELANHLYRIAQEAVTNAVRHGEARNVSVHLSCMLRKVRLVVSDDGKGIPNDASSGPGMGLKIMQYRARIANGQLKIERLDPHGTRIACECVLQTGRAKRVQPGRMRA